MPLSDVFYTHTPPVIRPLVVGIVNLTPDSFSGDGQVSVAQAVAHALQLAEDGADILDLGAESTRPGATPLPLEEELQRLLPVIEHLRQETTLPLAVDTYKADVAKACLDLGVTMINDISGAGDPEMLGSVAPYNAKIVLTHNTAKTHDITRTAYSLAYQAPEVSNFLPSLLASLQHLAVRAHKANIGDDRLILDPGFGFGKTVTHNLEILTNWRKLERLGYPLYAGFSRKSFIGECVQEADPSQRLGGTLACLPPLLQRAKRPFYLRVHDVKAVQQFLTMSERIKAHG